ncbi:Na-translocating system protein MpsC family protein [Heliorestis convoluta]|nr:Na-translocating system protein MpsC family protein [Heliorestis convoluta]
MNKVELVQSQRNIYSRDHFVGGSMNQLGHFKQQIQTINNKTNMEIFQTGLLWQKVEVIDDAILLITRNKRVPALQALDQKDRITTRLIDQALLEEYKERLKKALVEQLGIDFVTIFKDYDPDTEISVTIIIKKGKLTQNLRG